MNNQLKMFFNRPFYSVALYAGSKVQKIEEQRGVQCYEKGIFYKARDNS